MSTISHKDSVKNLSILLSNTYLLYLKTQNYHWNVEDTHFYILHELFEKQYIELGSTVDEIAERIRMLGEYSPARFIDFLKLATLKEDEAPITNGHIMLVNLSHDHDAIIKELKSNIQQLEGSDDEGTIDFLVGRLRAHEKTSWMLKSHLRNR